MTLISLFSSKKEKSYNRIIKLIKKVYYYRLKMLEFHLLNGAKKILIKLIHNNLKLKINI